MLDRLGSRVRELRGRRGLTLQQLAALCDLSPRFLVQVEKGRGNISVRNLDGLARALGTTSSALLSAAESPPDRPSIALLGLRGAGKTTVGRRLARRLRMRFVELDRHIEQRAGLRLAEVFSIHGEEYYRRLERDTLADLLASGQSMVLAVGGGLVTSSEAYNMLLRQTTTIWLKARADDCWTRVIRQGDRRPMDQHPQAREALRQLVVRREPLYARAAFTVDTSTLSIPQAVERAERAVSPKP